MDSYKLSYLYLYITNACNLSCKHCWVGELKKADGSVLTFDIVEHHVNQLISLGLHTVKITGGEPCLRKDLAEIIQMLHKKGITIQLETNGTMITQKLASLMAKCNVSVSVSLDACVAEFHDDFRGVRGAFNRAVDGIKALVDEGVRVHVIMSILKANAHLIFPTVHFCNELGVTHVKLNPVLPLGNAKGKESELLGLTELLKLADHIYSCESNIFLDLPCAFRPLSQLKTNLAKCPFLNLISILPNGDISFCGLGITEPNWVLGNISTVNWEDLWYCHPDVLAQREGLPEKLEGVCQECLLRTACGGGCRALAMSTNSGKFPPQPLCQTAYEQGLFPKTRLRGGSYGI